MIYDSRRDRCRLRGTRFVAGSGRFSDVWELPLSGTPEWRPLAFESLVLPGALNFRHLRSNEDRVVFFGGLLEAGGWTAEAWVLSLRNSALTLVAPAGEVPVRRWRHTAVHDVARNRMIVFGGNGDGFFMSNDTYALSLRPGCLGHVVVPTGTLPPRATGQTAIRQRADVLPQRRNVDRKPRRALVLAAGRRAAMELPQLGGGLVSGGHVAVFDPGVGRLVTHGGFDRANETWGFDLETGEWSLVAPREGAPMSRAGHAAVYDRRNDRMITLGWHYGSDDEWGVAPGHSRSGQPEWSPIRAPGRPQLGGTLMAFLDPDPAADRILIMGVARPVPGDDSRARPVAGAAMALA